MILEREGELATLSGLLDAVADSGGRVVLVRGEAGIGKSALVQRFAELARDRAHVLIGACDDLLTPQPFAPIWDVARQEPAVRAALEGGGESRNVMEALLALLSRDHRPTVLIVEDTQWADEATLDAIKFLGRRMARTKGLLVLTYRDGEVDGEHPLRQVVGELPPAGVVRLQLSRLSADAIAAMVGDGGLGVEKILELTGGNPLFVTEVLASGTKGVPLSIQDAVLGRASKLSPASRHVLHLVSVAPGGLERSLLDGVAEPSPEDLNAAVQHGLLEVADDVVSFRHELQRRAVEASLTADDRHALNRSLLEILGDDADPARLVHHAREAGDLAAVVAHGPRAARSAAAVGSHREAVAHFRGLDGLTDRLPPEDRAALLEDWARAESYLGDERAVQLVTDAIALRRDLGDPDDLANVLTFSVRVYERGSEPDLAAACGDEAIALLEGRSADVALAHALTQRAWLHFMRGTDDERAASLANQALELAEAGGDELAAIQALIWKGAVAHNVGDPAGMPLVQEAHARAARGGFRYEETIALVNLAGMCGDVREIARAADYVRRARETAARNDIWSLESYAQAMHAEILLWQGDWQQAEDTAAGAIGGPPYVATVAWRILGQLQARRGRMEAASILERVWEEAEQTQELQQMDPAASVLAEYAWLAGDEDGRWSEVIAATLDLAVATGPPWPSGALAFWAWKRDLVDDVPDHTPEYFRAIVEGRPEVAVEFWRSRGAPYEEAVALMHGDVDEQTSAIEIFEGLGAGAAADRVRQQLREAGVRVSRGRSAATRAHGAGLTARQAQVLDLLAEGLSNGEIADRLFISERTVENHVAAVLMKLDVADRHEAVALARERGLLGR